MSMILQSPQAMVLPSNGRLRSGIARTNRLTGFQILSTGSYVPDPVVTTPGASWIRPSGFRVFWGSV